MPYKQNTPDALLVEANRAANREALKDIVELMTGDREAFPIPVEQLTVREEPLESNPEVHAFLQLVLKAKHGPVLREQLRRAFYEAAIEHRRPRTTG